MSWIIIITFIFTATYILLIASFTYGWMRLKTIIPKTAPIFFNKISIIIAVKNEDKNILELLKSLQQINYPKNSYEIIIIDNKSNDNTVSIINTFVEENQLCWQLKSQNGGKKSAIISGIQTAKFDYILTIDGDCIVPKNLLNCYNESLIKNLTKMIAGPVAFESNGSFLGQLMELEFLSLIISGAGAIGAKIPIMLNAANLLFSKSVAIDSMSEVYSSKIVSGDDIFLMHYIIKKYGVNEIGFLKSSSAIVKTPAPETLNSFLKQRFRWTSKAKHYKINYTSIVGLIILCFNLCLFLTLSLSIINIKSLFLYANLLIIKILTDSILLISGTIFFDKKYLFKKIIILQLIYPFYIVFVGIFGYFSKPKWKD